LIGAGVDGAAGGHATHGAGNISPGGKPGKRDKHGSDEAKDEGIEEIRIKVQPAEVSYIIDCKDATGGHLCPIQWGWLRIGHTEIYAI
jgi:hypothetical protein